MEEKITSIRIHNSVKKLLDEIKVHPREPYEDVIKRLVELWKKQQK